MSNFDHLSMTGSRKMSSKLFLLTIFSILICMVVGTENPAADPSRLRYFYTDSSMKHSVAFKMLEPYEQMEVKEEILNVFGLDHRPKPKKFQKTDESASKYLLDLYTSFVTTTESNEITGNDLNELTKSDIVISFLNQIKTQRTNRFLRHHRDRRFWFNISDVPSGAEVMDSELRIYRDLKRSRINNSSYSFQLTLFRLSYGPDGKDNVRMQFVDSQRITGNTSGWLRFNVTGPLVDWIHGESNLGLYLQIRCDNIPKDLSPKMIGLVNSRGFHRYQPFMTAYFKMNQIQQSIRMPKANRARRAVNKRRSDISYYDNDDLNPYLKPKYGPELSRNCQKQELFVSFQDLNWQDWILAPDGYSAFYCRGDCPFPLDKHMNATNHAIIQMLIHLDKPHIPKPCCTPSELTSIMVLYFDDNSNVILRKFNDMVVKNCGCK